MKIFVSYSRNDQDSIKIIESVLSHNYECWHDEKLKPGSAWWPQICEQIENCELLIYALSKNSFSSVACAIERGYGERLGKNILCLKIDDLDDQHLPKDIQPIHYFRWRNDAITATKLNKKLSDLPSISTPNNTLNRPDPPPNYILNDILNEIQNEITKVREDEIVRLTKKHHVENESFEVCYTISSKLLAKGEVQQKHVRYLREIIEKGNVTNPKIQEKLEEWFIKNKYDFLKRDTYGEDLRYIIKKRGLLKNFKTPLGIEVYLSNISVKIKSEFNLVKWPSDSYGKLILVGASNIFYGAPAYFANKSYKRVKREINILLDIDD